MTKTKALESEITSLRNEMLSLRNEMNARFVSIEKRLPLIERLAQTETGLEMLEKQVGIKE